MVLRSIRHPTFTVIAHRGASAYRPENTYLAFDHALELGCSHIETDVRLTKDGVPVLMHDDTLCRYRIPGATAESMTCSQFEDLELGAWFGDGDEFSTPGARLDGLLARYGTKLSYHLEIKGDSAGIEERTYDLVARAGLLHRTIFTSFRKSALDTLRGIDSSVRTGWLVRSSAGLGAAELKGLHQICPRADSISIAEVKRLRKLNLGIRAWGLPDDKFSAAYEISRLAACGTDGVTSNWPELFPGTVRKAA